MTDDDGEAESGSFADHRQFVRALTPSAPVGNAELMKLLKWRQPGRFRRVRNSLIGLEVIRFDGGRGGSAKLAVGSRDLDAAIAAGMDLQAGREITLYPLLTDPVDRMITDFHTRKGHPLEVCDVSDGVRPYVTAAKRTGKMTGSYTRPDITVIVDLAFPHVGPWNDVHAVEVKPYWALGRDGLFEAAAQAALRRCTHSWLVAYIPPKASPGLNAQQRRDITEAIRQVGEPGKLGALSVEARTIGVGVARATSLHEHATLDLVVEPARQVMEPESADTLFAALGRVGG